MEKVVQIPQAYWLGGTRMGKNPGVSLVAGVALSLAGALVVFAAWGQVARKARIPGVLMPVKVTVQFSVHAAVLLAAPLAQKTLGRYQQLAQEGTENQSRKTILITALQSGLVSSIHLPKGESAQAGKSVATLVPVDASGQGKAELQAHLYAPSRNAGIVQPGQTVWMRYGSYPCPKFGLAQGQVQSISDTPTAPQDLPNGQSAALQSAAQTQESLYRIQVQLKDQNITAYGESLPLKPGMTLETDVVQEKRAVWEWVFEALLAARQKVKVL